MPLPSGAARDELLAKLEEQLADAKAQQLNLDITRGKPSDAQLDLSNQLDGLLHGNYALENTDLRNYGGLMGILPARQLFADILGTRVEETLVGDNSSLNLMYQAVLYAWAFGMDGDGSAWKQQVGDRQVKFICPVPGYDRHFSICEQFGIEMIPVGFTAEGPDMDAIETLLATDPDIKGIWCVPRFSNPTGHTYSDTCVQRFAKLARLAGPQFRIFWDNAYALHAFAADAPALLSIMDCCREQGTEESLMLFASSSKMTFAGSGISAMACASKNMEQFCKYLSINSIGPNKVNQLRHVAFLKNREQAQLHMHRHADILKPKFDLIAEMLAAQLGPEYGSWSQPKGGYFVSFDTLPGLAKDVVARAADAGVKLTAAGATFPHKNDPIDSNIRLAPTYPDIEELRSALNVFIICVKLATLQKA